MSVRRDGHVRVLPVHVANKIAAGEVVERPASAAKELVENAIDAGAGHIRISIRQGGRKLISVTDDGCGMSRDDAALSLERQATSKILDVEDIENIDTLGFRGEAIPSIASVSRFSITTRRHDSDEGTLIRVEAGQVAEISAAGCPPGTIVEVQDLFCNVPVRRKFLRSAATEESHIKNIFTVNALAHPEIAFTLTVDGRDVYNLPACETVEERITELFGEDFSSELVRIEAEDAQSGMKVRGFIERPNLSAPTRREQYIFVNSRPASSPSIAYALKEACPRRAGDTRPAAVIFLDVPPSQVDVNVHPTKKEVRFRDNFAVKRVIIAAVSAAMGLKTQTGEPPSPPAEPATDKAVSSERGKSGARLPGLADAAPRPENTGRDGGNRFTPSSPPATTVPDRRETAVYTVSAETSPVQRRQTPSPTPVPMEFAVEPDSTESKPWTWFKFLAQTDSGYLLIETDAGLVTVNPHAARERIAFEQLMNRLGEVASQQLLIPETVRFSPPEFARVKASITEISAMGFSIEEFGRDTFKIDAVPQLIGSLSPAAVLSTISRDLGEGHSRRAGTKWREELIAKSIARSFAGASVAMTEDGASRMIEELCTCRMPYVCPRGKPVMIFTSTRELNRKFERD